MRRTSSPLKPPKGGIVPRVPPSRSRVAVSKLDLPTRFPRCLRSIPQPARTIIRPAGRSDHRPRRCRPIRPQGLPKTAKGVKLAPSSSVSRPMPPHPGGPIMSQSAATRHSSTSSALVFTYKQTFSIGENIRDYRLKWSITPRITCRRKRAKTALAGQVHEEVRRRALLLIFPPTWRRASLCTRP